MQHEKLEPKLVTVLREGYSLPAFSRDLGAGLIVGIVALPLAIAFAIASGVKPEQGLYTAIVAGFVISLLSGSRVQIGGPTGAFIVLLSDIVARHGYEGLATATFLAGVILVLMGFARLGAVIEFVPYPVTVGFTSGIALIILAGQLRDFFGLRVEQVPAGFLPKLAAFGGAASTCNPAAFAIALLTLLTVRLWPRLTGRVPGSLVALVAATAAVHVFGLSVDTIGSRFGAVPSTLPAPSLPDLSLPRVRELFSPALSIALLAGIESLLSAVVADGMTGRRHRSNMELIGQGVANMTSPLFSGIAATGAIARTATNVKNGGTTPVAGMVHALALLLILLFFGRYAALVPLAALAGILVNVAYTMSEWHLFIKLFRSPRADVVVLLVTFLLTVLVDLTVAIQVGMVLAAFLFMRRMAEVTEVGFVTDLLSGGEDGEGAARDRRRAPSGVEVFEVNGPFFFGAAEKFKSSLQRAQIRARVLVLGLSNAPAIDATGVRALEELLASSRRTGTEIVLAGLRRQPREVLEKAGFLDQVGGDNVCADVEAALARARVILG